MLTNDHRYEISNKTNGLKVGIKQFLPLPWVRLLLTPCCIPDLPEDRTDTTPCWQRFAPYPPTTGPGVDNCRFKTSGLIAVDCPKFWTISFS